MAINRRLAMFHEYFKVKPLVKIAAQILLLGIFLMGCAPLKPETDPTLDAKARDLANQVQAFNSAIETSKGTGWVRLTTANQKEKFKIAWAAGTPNRLRLTALVSGHPMETIAASGEWVSFISHTGKHKPHSAVSVDPDLATYIQVPVRLSEMVTILLGRIPIRPFDQAWFAPGKTDTIYLKKRFSSQTQEIAFTPEGQVAEFRLIDQDGRLLYALIYRQFQEKNGRLIPTDISIEDGSGRTLEITLSGLVPNAPVKESMFRLTGTGS